jgi:ABC-2 type transport system ATP-binding protein
MQQSDIAIEAEGLVKVYRTRDGGGVRALDGLSFRVRTGEIVGLLGPNGAGKTTCISILATLIRPTAGTARVMGHDVVRAGLDVRRSICAVLQETAVEQYLSVEDNLLVYGLFHGLSRAQIRERGARVMALFGLETERRRMAIDLSGGFKRRLQVAKVFLHDAPVVFLDEATTGMDPINKRVTLRAIAEEARRGRTIILTTHLMDEAEELCDRLLFIDRGRAVLEGDLSGVKARAGKVFEVTASFEAMDDGRRERIARIPALRREYSGRTVQLTVDAAAVPTQELVAALADVGTLTHIDIRGASLEDIFLQLLGPGGEGHA